MKTKYSEYIRKNHFTFYSLLLFVIILKYPVISQNYNPPIGIPAPEFGIVESHMMFSDSLFDFGEGPQAYKDAGNGPYTHYIDKNNPNATDENNPYGTAETPRLSIPKTLTAGSVVEIHYGTYNGISGTYYMGGTNTNPVFFRGISDTTRPVISNSVITLSGHYFIVENLDFYNKTTIRFTTSSSYGSLRNSEVHNPIGATGASNPTISVTGEHMVIYNNEIHDNIRDSETDCHGIQVSNYGNRIWVLNNNIYNNGGDGIQACHMCNPGPKYLYIGRNRFHHDNENGVDLKYASDVIISENIFYDYAHTSTTGIVSPIVIGSDGAPTRVWVLYNEIFGSKKGIRIEEINDLWIIGNVIHDITESGIIPEKKGTRTRIMNNTLYNMNHGISDPWQVNFSFYVFNNIFSNISGKSIALGPVFYNVSEVSNNLFWQTDTYGDNIVTGDPLFTNIDERDFSLQETSAAIDSGSAQVSGIINDFYEMYGVDISKDFVGETRPQGNDWDIGAYEYSTGTFPAQHVLSVNFNEEHGSVWPTGGNYTEGTAVKITAIPKDGYLFNGWSGDLDGLENPAYVTMDGEKSITANFIVNTKFSLTIYTSGKGSVSISPDSVLYANGTIVTLTAVPDNGEQFIEWNGDIFGTENPVQITMDSDKEVTAFFSSPATEDFVVEAIDPQTGKFDAYWNARTTANLVDGIIGFSEAIPDEYNDFSCKILFNNTGLITVSNGTSFTADQSVEYTANQGFAFKMTVDMTLQTYSVWVTPEGESEILLADSYAFSPTAGVIDSINYRSVKMSFDPQWGGAEGMVEIWGFSIITGFNDNYNQRHLPLDYSIKNFPNPFNPSTTIQFNVPKTSFIKVEIFNISGQRIKTLVQGNYQPGVFSISWNGKDHNNKKVASGMYFYQLKAGGFVKTKKMLLIE